MTKHKATRIYDDLDGNELLGYMYRGKEIDLNSDVPAGYWRRYSIGGYRNGMGFTTLAQAKWYIDQQMETE